MRLEMQDKQELERAVGQRAAEQPGMLTWRLRPESDSEGLLLAAAAGMIEAQRIGK